MENINQTVPTIGEKSVVAQCASLALNKGYQHFAFLDQVCYSSSRVNYEPLYGDAMDLNDCPQHLESADVFMVFDMRITGTCMYWV